MPDIVDAGTVYNQKIVPVNAHGPNPIVVAPRSPKATGKAKKAQSWQEIVNNNHGQTQMEMDVAMWYGAIASPGISTAAKVIARCFHLIYYGSMVVKGEDNTWKSWRSLSWPVAMALSHGGRVLVQLPRETQMPGNSHAAFWNWLWGNDRPQSRKAATHGIDRSTNPNQNLYGGRRLYMKETGGKMVGAKSAIGLGEGQHFGVEIALGGAGNKNPFSGQPIAANGSAGHLYIYYLQPTAQKYGGVLIGCEGSSPTDRGVMTDDHYGGGHSIFGGSNTFSGTGGLKFGEMKDPNASWLTKKFGRAEKRGWQNVVAGGKTSMVIDLITPPQAVANIMAKPAFVKEWLGNTGAAFEPIAQAAAP